MSALGAIALNEFLAAGAYRPANWGQPQQYSLTCTLPGLPATSVTSSGSVGGVATPDASGTGANTQAATGSPTTYYFDAILLADHTQEAVGTRHPVQVGPAIIDHVYLLPARIVLQVKMSNAMQSFIQGQYSSVPSKSVSAFQAFLQIQASRAPITLVTRLKTYQNMWLSLVNGHDDFRTSQGFNGTLHFEQIISATVSSQTVSARPNATNTTSTGTLSTQPPSFSTLNGVDAIPKP